MKQTKKKDSELLEESKRLEEERQDNLQRRIDNRNLLAQEEEVVFKALNNALKTKTLSHAVLFSGVQSALKKDCAYLLAQSIFLDAGELIKEEELSEEDKSLALRVIEGNHADFISLDGYKESIKLEDTLDIQALFNKTASETSGKKVYLIEHIENMTTGAMNGLLKFLEEPAQDVFAILTTDNIERILPTIISRCIQYPFHSLDSNVYERRALESGIDSEDAYLLSHIVHQLEGYEDIVVSEPYQNAKSMFKQAIGVEGNKAMTMVDYEVRYRFSSKEDNLMMLEYFFAMFIQYHKDLIVGKKVGPSWYYDAIEKDKNLDIKIINKSLKAAVDAKNSCNRNNDLNLVFARFVFQWEEAIDE